MANSSLSANETDWRTQPTYAAAFRCIGPACEDHCCGGWDIPLDPKTFRQYEELDSPTLAPRVAEFVQINPPPQPAGHFARIRQTPAGLCPFFEADRLCAIQAEGGPALLSASCSIYPRSLSVVGGRLEGSLSLSCPEAARNILLQPGFMQQVADLHSGTFRTDNVYLLDGESPIADSDFRAVRRAMIELIQDPRWPLPQRLLLLGRLCEQVNKLGTKTDHAAMLRVVRGFQPENALEDLRDTIGDIRLLLDVVFELTEVLVQDGSEPRFQETFLDFVQGISASPAGSAAKRRAGTDADRFLDAEQGPYQTFLDRHPAALENLLTNAMLQTLFPCGRTGSERFDPQSVLGEYLQLVTRFVWLNVLLVGVAGRYGEQFAGEHLVKTVQSFTRAVEHYPSVLIWMREVMQQRGLHTLPGIAILLKR